MGPHTVLSSRAIAAHLFLIVNICDFHQLQNYCEAPKVAPPPQSKDLPQVEFKLHTVVGIPEEAFNVKSK